MAWTQSEQTDMVISIYPPKLSAIQLQGQIIPIEPDHTKKVPFVYFSVFWMYNILR